MSDYDNTDTGILFANDKRENDKQPTHTGKINIGGKEMRLAAWVRESKNGRKFFSLKVSEFQTNQEQAQQATQSLQKPDDEFDQEIPF